MDVEQLHRLILEIRERQRVAWEDFRHTGPEEYSKRGICLGKWAAYMDARFMVEDLIKEVLDE